MRIGTDARQASPHPFLRPVMPMPQSLYPALVLLAMEPIEAFPYKPPTRGILGARDGSLLVSFGP